MEVRGEGVDEMEGAQRRAHRAESNARGGWRGAVATAGAVVLVGLVTLGAQHPGAAVVLANSSSQKHAPLMRVAAKAADHFRVAELKAKLLKVESASKTKATTKPPSPRAAAAAGNAASKTRLGKPTQGKVTQGKVTQGDIAEQLREIEHKFTGAVKTLAPAVKKMTLEEEAPSAEAAATLAEPAHEAAAEAPAAAAAQAAVASPAAAAAAETPAAVPAAEAAAEAAESAPEGVAVSKADIVGCAGQPGGCVGTQRAEREFIPLLIFAVIGALMFWSYLKFQTYDREPEKSAPAPTRTVMFAPSRRVYDTFGAEMPAPSSHGLQKNPRSQHVPYYSVASNV